MITMHMISNLDRTLFHMDRFVANLPIAATDIIHDLGWSVLKHAKSHIVPKFPKTRETEDLKESIVIARSGRDFVSVQAQASYARFVEHGTSPHEIPNNPLWGMRGKVHPGAQAYPSRFFMRRAMVKAIAEVRDIINVEANVNKLMR